MSRRIALVCLTPPSDAGEHGRLDLPSYGIRRIQAAVAADPERPGHVVRLIDHGREDVAAYVDSLLAFDPDLIGFSIFVWSMDCLIAVARDIRRRKPACAIVFGGPSARAAVFDLPYYQDARPCFDALVEGEGEVAFRAIARLPALDAGALATVPGLTLPRPDGWHRTPPAPPAPSLDHLPSPYRLGLMPAGAVAYLETFRGCPLSCRFCEWGVHDRSRSLFSAGYVAAELAAIGALRPAALFLLDAGLNLNLRAFRNLREAAAATGTLRGVPLWAEVYPAAIRQEHLDFLQEVGPAYLGVGLQSTDPEILRLHQRPADSPRFEAAIRQLAAITEIEVQIIFGLPGDSPAGFRRTLDYALSLPAAVRAYHCLVLPDALMTRGLPEWNMVFDPRSLAMTSCLGWPAREIVAMRRELTARTRAMGGRAGHFWWSFPTHRHRGAA